MTPESAQKLILIALVASAVGLWLAMPQRADWYRTLAAFGSALGLLALVSAFDGPNGNVTEQTLFWIFAGGAILCSIFMITCTDPVQGALWFSVATLSVCGLFLQLSAPFLAAATVIVYAGAIIVTFMFVIMLAQQDGATTYDQRARHPLPAVCASFFLLGVLAMNLNYWSRTRPPAVAGPMLLAADVESAHPLSRIDPRGSTDDLYALGRSLFGDYLFAVELAGTLLLVATIGAIMMAPRRAQGTL